MGLVVVLLLLALVFGGVAWFVAKWLFIIAVILFIAGALSGVRARGRRP